MRCRDNRWVRPVLTADYVLNKRKASRQRFVGDLASHITVCATYPPQLPETLGYRGNARFVGFYWSPLGDQLVATDGINSATGQSWAYIGYKRHRAVFPLLEPFDLGSSEEDAVHMLLIDRTASRANIAASVDEDPHVSRRPTPSAPGTHPRAARSVQPGTGTVARRVAGAGRSITRPSLGRWPSESGDRVGRMMAWLEMCPVPEQGEGPAP